MGFRGSASPLQQRLVVASTLFIQETHPNSRGQLGAEVVWETERGEEAREEEAAWGTNYTRLMAEG